MPAHPLSLDVRDTAVLLVDVQERLFAAMPDGVRDRVLHQQRVLLEGARALGVPVVVSEQYPKGLGPTVAALREAAPDVTPLEKLAFSCCGDDGIARALEGLGRGTLLVAGMETHICVFQTVADLVARGYRVHVLGDACLSRRKEHWRSGLDLCRAAGAAISNTETALFQLLGVAGTDAFKAISRLVR